MTETRDGASSGLRIPRLSVDTSTPEGLAAVFADGAGECLWAAQYLDKGVPDLTGEYILVFHAVELGLKAFLIRQGVAEEDLRRPPYGHDLVKLYEDAKARGLSLQSPEADAKVWLEWINEWHNKGVRIRYDFASWR